MPTNGSQALVDSQWTYLGGAPLTFSVSTGTVQICVSASLPAQVFKGHEYKRGEGDTITLYTGNIYGKSSGGAASIIVTVA
jgi:hypothetical protein